MQLKYPYYSFKHIGECYGLFEDVLLTHYCTICYRLYCEKYAWNTVNKPKGAFSTSGNWQLTLFSKMARLSRPKASCVALLLNSAMPKGGWYSGIRVGSVAICCLILRMRGTTTGWPSSPRHSEEEDEHKGW